MGLTRAPGRIEEVFDYVVFGMVDTENDYRVACRVSRDALRQLNGGRAPWMVGTFELHRDTIEHLAHRRYIAGELLPTVTACDL